MISDDNLTKLVDRTIASFIFQQLDIAENEMTYIIALKQAQLLSLSCCQKSYVLSPDNF